MNRNIFFQIVLIGLITTLMPFGNSLFTQANAQTINLEFERELTSEEQNSATHAIAQRLSAAKIRSRGIELIDNKNLHIRIRSEKDIEMAKKLLAHQGLFSIIEVFDNQEMMNTLKEIDDELKLVHNIENSILDFLILIDPKNENMPFMSLNTVIGFCNPDDTMALMQLLRHPGIKEMMPTNITFRWMKEKHDEKLQLVGLKFAEDEMQINQDYISSVSSGENQLGQKNLTVILNSDGAERWKEITGKNIGKHLAIMLDNVIYAAPVVQSSISSGRLDIERLTGEELDIFSKTLSADNTYPVKLSSIKLIP